MGLEAACTVRVGRKSAQGKALLESESLIVRGDLRFEIGFDRMREVSVDGDTLVVKTGEQEVRLQLGERAAEVWMRRIKEPKGLFEKLELLSEPKMAASEPRGGSEAKMAAAEAKEAKGASSDGKLAAADTKGSDGKLPAADTKGSDGKLPAADTKGSDGKLPTPDAKGSSEGKIPAADTRIAAVDVQDPVFLATLRDRFPGLAEGRVPQGATVVFFGAETREALRKIPLLRARIAETGTLWIIRPKGSKTLAEADVLHAIRDAGLADTKVVALSRTHTAHKAIVPVELRGSAVRRRPPIVSLPPPPPGAAKDPDAAESEKPKSAPKKKAAGRDKAH